MICWLSTHTAISLCYTPSFLPKLTIFKQKIGTDKYNTIPLIYFVLFQNYELFFEVLLIEYLLAYMIWNIDDLFSRIS